MPFKRKSTAPLATVPGRAQSGGEGGSPSEEVLGAGDGGMGGVGREWD